MTTSRKQYEVIGAIIGSNSIYMVNNIVKGKLAFNFLKYYKSVFENTSFDVGQLVSREINFNIPVRSEALSTDAISFIREFFPEPPSRVSPKAGLTFSAAISLLLMACSKINLALLAVLENVSRNYCSIGSKPNISVRILSVSTCLHLFDFHKSILSNGGLLNKC